MSSKKSESGFLVQGSILAAASIISRIIGLLYRIPLNNIIGAYGNDYYSCAYEIYSMMLLISSYSLPMAVSKMVSARMAQGKKADAYRVFKGALAIAGITGTAGCIIVFFGAEFLTDTVFKTPLSFYALRVLAPTLIIVAVLGVLRGFFQGLGTMVPSAVSQIIEQIVNAIVSVGAAYVLFSYGARVMLVLDSEQHYDAAYGAAGGTLGTGAGAAFGLIFCLFVFVTYRKTFKKAIRREKRRGNAQPEQYSAIFKILIFTIVPVLLSTTLYNLVSIVDQGMFKNICVSMGYDEDQISTWWGLYSGYYKVLVNVPISIASALATSAVPTISAAFAKKEDEQIRHKIALSLRFVMIIAAPCAAGLMALSGPIMQFLFPGTDALAGKLLLAGGISIIFYSISTLSNATLQAIDRMTIPIRNAVISLAVNVVAMVICLLAFKMNIYAVIAGNIVFSLVMCLLNGMSVKKYSGFSPDITKTFIKPVASAVVMGVAVYFVYKVIYRLISINSISTIISILAGIIIYAVVILLIKGITEPELKQFPKGTLLVRIAKKIHLL